MHYTAAPNDSRYIPFTQAPECCVPTSLLMIMYRHGLPLLPAEELGYHLGLTVPPDEAHLFQHARVSDTPPVSGYGTQIFLPEYDPNKIFPKLGIPLKFRLQLAGTVTSESAFVEQLHAIEHDDTDALLCFNHGVIQGQYRPHSGHVAVFDRLIDGRVRLVDASPKQPKWRLIEPALLLDAIKRHGNASAGGIWHFELQR